MVWYVTIIINNVDHLSFVDLVEKCVICDSLLCFPSQSLDPITTNQCCQTLFPFLSSLTSSPRHPLLLLFSFRSTPPLSLPTGPCKQLAPFFRTLAAEYPHVACAKIDYDDYTDICEEDGVASLPTLIFFKEGKKVHTHVGVNKDKIIAAFKEHFGQ